ncbi:hypothetical protein WKI13_11540 [Teredinibacter turnerae]|uniref:hypothetical protein n=1 Tax=Teredinibacter turnerae TaxID=2426 RepID=UPI0012FA08B1|nr:hypothetical protein [Teredinibacter turnerae]
MEMRKISAILIALLSTNLVEAGEATTQGKIIASYTSGAWTMVRIDSQSTKTFGCEKPNWYAINSGDSNYQTIVSSILAAQMAQKEVSFWVSGCGGQAGSYPKIESIVINS